MIWSFVKQIGGQASNLLIFFVLALFLGPADYGILGMSITWIAFISVFSEMGFGAALIQKQNIGSKHFSTVFFLNIVSGVLLTLIGIILSWPAALFFKTPEVQPIMAVLSVSFVINSFSLTQMAIAQKKMNFRALAIRDILASLIGGIAGVTFAWLHFGAWSLVIQKLTASVIGAVLLWTMSKWRPNPKEISFQYVKDLWPYSSRIFTFNIFKYFVQNSDKLLVGYFLGPAAIGLYVFASKIMLFPINSVLGAIGSYLFPKFSRMQEDLDSIKSTYLYANKLKSSIVAPLIVVAALSSSILIPLIFGQKWVPAVPLIQILAIGAFAQSLIFPVGQLMKALNRPGWLLMWSIFRASITSVFILLGTYQGIIGSTIGLSIAYVLFIPIAFIITIKLIHVGFKNILRTQLPSITAALLMGLLLRFVLKSDVFLLDLRVVIGLFFSLSLYLIILIWLDKAFMVTVYRRLVKA